VIGHSGGQVEVDDQLPPGEVGVVAPTESEDAGDRHDAGRRTPPRAPAHGGQGTGCAATGRGLDRLRDVDLEEKYAIGLGVLSVVLLVVGAVLGRALSHAPARVTRTVFPIAAACTLAAFGIFVVIARAHVKG
jgi:hypothetical protein